MACRVGNLLFTSGISGASPETNEMPESVEEQVANCFRNLANVLAKAGATPGDIGLVTVMIKEAGLRPLVNKPWLEMFPDEHSRPARHTVVQENLNFMIQLQVIPTSRERRASVSTPKATAELSSGAQSSCLPAGRRKPRIILPTFTHSSELAEAPEIAMANDRRCQRSGERSCPTGALTVAARSAGRVARPERRGSLSRPHLSQSSRYVPLLRPPCLGGAKGRALLEMRRLVTRLR